MNRLTNWMPNWKLTAAVAMGTSVLCAQSDAPKRLQAAADSFKEVMGTPDKAIPQDLLNKAQCIVIVPGLKKGAFIVGAKYGKGFVACRKKDGVGWTAPAAVRVEGGSFGFQIGGEETDVFMLVMNQKGHGSIAHQQVHPRGRCFGGRRPGGTNHAGRDGCGDDRRDSHLVALSRLICRCLAQRRDASPGPRLEYRDVRQTDHQSRDPDERHRPARRGQRASRRTESLFEPQVTWGRLRSRSGCIGPGTLKPETEQTPP